MHLLLSAIQQTHLPFRSALTLGDRPNGIGQKEGLGTVETAPGAGGVEPTVRESIERNSQEKCGRSGRADGTAGTIANATVQSRKRQGKIGKPKNPKE